MTAHLTRSPDITARDATYGDTAIALANACKRSINEHHVHAHPTAGGVQALYLNDASTPNEAIVLTEALVRFASEHDPAIAEALEGVLEPVVEGETALALTLEQAMAALNATKAALNAHYATGTP